MPLLRNVPGTSLAFLNISMDSMATNVNESQHITIYRLTSTSTSRSKLESHYWKLNRVDLGLANNGPEPCRPRSQTPLLRPRTAERHNHWVVGPILGNSSLELSYNIDGHILQNLRGCFSPLNKQNVHSICCTSGCHFSGGSHVSNHQSPRTSQVTSKRPV